MNKSLDINEENSIFRSNGPILGRIFERLISVGRGVLIRDLRVLGIRPVYNAFQLVLLTVCTCIRTWLPVTHMEVYF